MSSDDYFIFFFRIEIKIYDSLKFANFFLFIIKILHKKVDVAHHSRLIVIQYFSIFMCKNVNIFLVCLVFEKKKLYKTHTWPMCVNLYEKKINFLPFFTVSIILVSVFRTEVL